MNIVFTYSHFYTGGSETLIYRLSKHFITSGNRVDIFCIDMIDAMQKSFIDLKIAVHYKNIRFPDAPEIDKADIVISFGDRDYVQLECHKYAKDLKYRNLLYVVHPKTLRDWSLVYHNKLWNLVAHARFREAVKEAIKYNGILFMDWQCLEETRSFHDLHLDGSSRIAPVPYDFDKIDDDNLREKSSGRSNRTVILSVARADFPFKGYILGLIDIYRKIKESNPQVYLRIISYGKDIAKIREKIGPGDDIELVEGMDYETLLQEYKKAHICVGMGTTLLEASNAGNIVIPVESYTYECKSWGFFDTRVDWLLTDCGKGDDVTDLLIRAVEYTDNEYIDAVTKTYDKASKYYDVGSVSDIIINWHILDVINNPLLKLGWIYEADYRICWLLRKAKRIVTKGRQQNAGS